MEGVDYIWTSVVKQFSHHSHICNSANWLWAGLCTPGHTHSSWQASRGPLCDVQPILAYSWLKEMCAWAYRTVYGCQPEIERYLNVLPAGTPVLYTLSLWEHAGDWKPALKPTWEPAWGPARGSCGSGGVEFSSTGSLWRMANSEFVEALPNRSL